MNVVELYKKLPRTNCGKCGPRACMPFAVSVIKGDAVPSDCPLLPPEEVSALGTEVVQGDWREALISKLGEEVSAIDFRETAEGIGAEIRDDNSLSLKCLGRDFVISPDGTVKTQGKTTPWIKILILHYIKSRGKG